MGRIKTVGEIISEHSNDAYQKNIDRKNFASATCEEKNQIYANCISSILLIPAWEEEKIENCEGIEYRRDKDLFYLKQKDGLSTPIDLSSVIEENQNALLDFLSVVSIAKEIDLEEANKKVEENCKEYLKTLLLVKKCQKLQTLKLHCEDDESISISQREVIDLVKNEFFGGKLPDGGIHTKHHLSLNDIEKAAEDYFNLGLYRIREWNITNVSCFLHRKIDDVNNLFAVDFNGETIDLEYYCLSGTTEDNEARLMEIEELLYERTFNTKEMKTLANIIESESKKFFNGEECLFEEYKECPSFDDDN